MMRRSRRKGMSLLELVVATAIMAAIVTAAAALLRTSQTVWNSYNGDVAKLDAAHAVLRHVVRQLRQCWSISAITAAANTNGSLSAVDGNGVTHVWAKSGTNVNYGLTTASHLLAPDISQLSFVGYQGDNVTTTTTVVDIRSVQCTAVVTLDRATNATKTIRCRAWLRAW